METKYHEMDDLPFYSENILGKQFKYIFTVKCDISCPMVLSFWMHSCSCTVAWLYPVVSWKLIAR